MTQEFYTAEEVANMLASAGFKITRRKVNYYAFEKKMFQPAGSGKKVFSPADIDKIQGIIYLRDQSKLTLEQIKAVINEEDFSLEEIKRRYGKPEARFQSYARQSLKQTFNFTVYDRHLILDLDSQKVLLSSGVSTSFGDKPLTLLGQKHQLVPTFIGASAENVSKYIGTKIDVVLGGDILKNLYLEIDLDKEIANFSTTIQDHTGEPLSTTLALNVPVITIELRGNPIRVFLDTGAKVSYLRSEILGNYYPSAKQETDFYPGLGPFDVKTYAVPIKLAGTNITVNFGSLPEQLEVALLMAGCDGILGHDLFRYFNPVSFNLPGFLINLQKRAIPLA